MVRYLSDLWRPLRTRITEVEGKTIIEGDILFTHFEGVMVEQYVCQQLISDNKLRPYYWSAARSTGEADFIVQAQGNVAPIEAKAEESLKAKSLASFCKTYNLNNAVRLSLLGYRQESWLRS